VSCFIFGYAKCHYSECLGAALKISLVYNLWFWQIAFWSLIWDQWDNSLIGKYLTKLKKIRSSLFVLKFDDIEKYFFRVTRGGGIGARLFGQLTILPTTIKGCLGWW
jgi:hypothetical protein